MQKNFEITVDTVKGVRNQALVVNTNDLQTLKFSITITQHNQPVDLTGSTVRIAVKKPDKKSVFQDCTIVDAKTGKCEVILTTQAYIVPGLHAVEVMVYYAADTVAVTGRFSYTSTKGLLDDESIASTNEFQALNKAITDVENIVVDLRENGTGIDAQARQDLEKVTSDLAQTSNLIPNVANGKSTIDILNPYDNFQNIHPKVLYFENGWKGYKFWMAYTPYPGGNTKQENPCIAVSNDGISWSVPVGASNVALDEWSGITDAYNNDTHLVYRQDTGKLEIWWRYAHGSDKVVTLHRRTTTDGVNWTAKETLFTGTQDFDDHICPAVIFEDNKYKMLSVNTVSGKRAMFYSESVDALNWSNRVAIVADWDTKMPWHMDFIKDGNVYKMVVQGIEDISGNNTASLYYQESADLINWTKPIKILSPTNQLEGFDNQGIYRSSIVKVGKVFYVYYSAISTNKRRALSLAYSENILTLKGFDSFSFQVSRNTDIVNTVDIKQKSNPERWGGLKVGNLLFADGTTDGVTPQNGSIRFNPTIDAHQRYESRTSSWIPLVKDNLMGKRLIVEKTAAQPLTPNQFDVVKFEYVRFVDGVFENNNFTINGAGTYRFELGLVLNNIVDGDTIEIWLRRGGSQDLKLFAKEKMYGISGSFYVNSITSFDLAHGNQVSVVVKYGGSSQNVQLTQYHHNYLLIERL